MNLYSEYYLSKKAERFVNKIWVLDNTPNGQAVKNRMVVPNGCFNLALVNGNGWEVTIRNRSYKMLDGTYLSAQFTQKASIDIEAHTRVIIIQLRACSLSLFSACDLTKFRDEITQVDADHFPFLNYISPAFCNDIDEVIELSNKYFEVLSDLNPEKSPTELMCTHSESQNDRILKTVEGLNYSNRALQKAFKKSTGLTRKQYSKILKLRKSVDYISQPEDVEDTLTSIAYKSGYFDQTHFIKTFKEIVKITPKKFDSQSFFLSQIR